MNILLSLFRKWTLLIAIIVGLLISGFVEHIAFLSPYLISSILVLTFSKLSVSDLRVTISHLVTLAFQLIVAMLLFFLLRDINYIIACGAMITVLIPNATSSPAVVRMLKGDVEYITSYLFFCNMVMMIASPVIFSIAKGGSDISFLDSVTGIASKVGALLFIPLIIAWVIKKSMPKVNKRLVELGGASFYIWAIALTIVTGNTIRFLRMQERESYYIVAIMLAVSLILCIVQFWVGGMIGKRFKKDQMTTAQSLGQKNTILAIWMAQTFFDPICSVVPAGYVIWQNLYNSWQLARYKNKQAKSR